VLVVKHVGSGSVKVDQRALVMPGRAVPLYELALRPPKGVRSLKGDKVSLVETHLSEFLL
jgi:hypothetical protein